MKLSDIFESYLDKFYGSELGKASIKSDFTFNDLADYLEKEHIAFNLYPGEDFDSASTIDLADVVRSYEENKTSLPDNIQELLRSGFTHLIQLETPPDIGFEDTLESTGQKKRILAVLQHELQHIPQPSTTKDQYLQPSITSSAAKVDYVVQALERPNQAVNIAQDLLDLRITANQFINDLKAIERQAVEEVKSVGWTDPGIVNRLLRSIRNGQYSDSDFELIKLLLAEYVWFGVEFAVGDRDHRSKRPKVIKAKRAKLNVFLKQLASTYRKLKGYHQRYH